MAIIDFVAWQPQGSTVVYAHRYPETNLSTYTQLVVSESQEAVLLSKGQFMGKFGPGKHTLNTENLPILRSLYGIPFGGKNPFMAEVWFVNKVQTFKIEWDVTNVSIHDVDYNNMLPLAASGQYGLKIIDSEKFLKKVVGTRHEFTEYDMTDQFTGEFSTKVKSALVGFMVQNRVGFKQINAYLDQLSEHLRTTMTTFWDDLGLELTRFYVSTVEIDDSTPQGAKVKQALADQSAQAITGYTWQQQQMFDTANNAIGTMGQGGTGGLLGGLMAINMMGGMGGGGGAVGGAMMQPQYQQPSFGGPQGGMAQGGVMAPGAGAGMHQQARMVYCGNCAKRFPSTSEFCPNCGHKYRPCPNCGSDNDDNARRCVSCGAQLMVENRCSGCGNTVPQGMAFCPNCGRSMGAVDSSTCSRCGSPFPPESRFCPRCGNRRS